MREIYVNAYIKKYKYTANAYIRKQQKSQPNNLIYILKTTKRTN